jgi:predicted DNA-binding transcriptional regulator YafY
MPRTTDISIRLLLALKDRRGASCRKAELSKKLKISKRTLNRELAKLETRGAKIHSGIDADKKGTVLMIEGPPDDPTPTKETGLALHIARLALGQAGTEAWVAQLNTIADSLNSLLAPRERRIVEALKKRVVVRGMVDDPLGNQPGVLEAVMEALSGERGVREVIFSYRAPTATTAKAHRLVPHSLVYDTWSGGTFLLGWEPEKCRPEQYRLERMEEASCSDDLGIVTDTTAMERFSRYHFGGRVDRGEPMEFKVLILDQVWAQAIREAPPSLPDFVYTIDANGIMVVGFKATEFRAPGRWVLQFGPHAEALEPSEFRRYIAEQVQNTCGRYNQEG